MLPHQVANEERKRRRFTTMQIADADRGGETLRRGRDRDETSRDENDIARITAGPAGAMTGAMTASSPMMMMSPSSTHMKSGALCLRDNNADEPHGGGAGASFFQASGKESADAELEELLRGLDNE